MSALRSEPFYISSSAQQIFLLQYAPAQAPDELIIFCPPAPQETMRSQASLGQLARRLQESGRTVIRFDYSGTGDSDGPSDSLSLDQWLLDLLSVHAWAITKRHYQRVSMLGLRLGAALAIRASTHVALERLVLWDPIVDGLNYLRDMEASHTRMFQLNPVEAPFASSRYGNQQCWGFPWPAFWRSQLAAISPAGLVPQAKKTHIILGAIDSLIRDTSENWAKDGVNLNIQQVGEPLYWGDERFAKIRAFPGARLRRIQAVWEARPDE